MPPEISPLLFVAPLLLYMVASDMSFMRIPNRLILGMIAVFIVVAPIFLSPDEILARLAVSGGVLFVGLVAFLMRWFAGGDVKALFALFLFIPAEAIPIAYFGFTFSAAMLIGMSIMIVLRQRSDACSSSLVSLSVDKGYPMGLSIGLAGIAYPAVWWLFAGS